MRFFNSRSEIRSLTGALACAMLLSSAASLGCSAIANADASGGEFGSSYGEDGDGYTAGTAGSDNESDSAGDGGGDGGDGYDIGSGADPEAECNPWVQDCVEGERCAWVSDIDPTSGTATGLPVPTCVPVSTEAPAIGEACRVVAGVDTCEAGAHCAYTDAYGDGVCLALCSGDPDAPECPDDDECKVCDDCPSVCAPSCHPLESDACPDPLLCAPASPTGPFSCTVDASNDEAGILGASCEFANECGEGYDCIDAESVPGCAEERCCAPYCEIPTNGVQPNATSTQCPSGTTCQSWSQSGALEGLENLGICKAPL